MTSSAITVAIKRLAHGGDLPLPSYATKDAAGMDLVAAVAADLVLKPGKRAIVPSSFMISQITPIGRQPARTVKSTAASV